MTVTDVAIGALFPPVRLAESRDRSKLLRLLPPLLLETIDLRFTECQGPLHHPQLGKLRLRLSADLLRLLKSLGDVLPLQRQVDAHQHPLRPDRELSPASPMNPLQRRRVVHAAEERRE